jgi:hypothetical protein
MRKAILAVAVLAVAALAAAYWNYASVRPVMLTASELDDVCGTVSTVDAGEAATVILRVRPSRWSAARGELASGTQLIVCEEHGAWSGVILRGPDCAIDHDAKATVAYEGPCKSGWIRSDRLALTAG